LFNPIDVEIVVGLSSPFTVCLCVVVIVVEVATAETLAFAVAFAFGRAGAKLEMDESDSVSVERSLFTCLSMSVSSCFIDRLLGEKGWSFTIFFGIIVIRLKLWKL